MRRSKQQQRVIERLDQQSRLVRTFLNDWLVFNQILSAFPNSGEKKGELEHQFLQVKSKLAREHKVLHDNLGHDYQLDANTMNIVSGATTLEGIYGQSDMSVKKLQQEWHRALIAINETLGGIEHKKARAEGGADVNAGTPESSRKSYKPTLKHAMMLAVVVLALFAGFLFTPPGRPVLDAVNDYIRERGVLQLHAD